MKIVQFITRMDVIGGAQVHVLELTKGLIEKGHEVIVISSGFGVLTDELEALSISYYSINELTVNIHPINDLRTSIQVRKLLRSLQPDLIAIHSSKAGIIGRLIGKSLNVPAVFTAHSWSFANGDNRIKHLFYIMIERAVSHIPTGIISVSYFDELLADKYLFPSNIDRIIIHNGIHDSPYISIPKNNLDKIRLVMVARFAEPKDHNMLLEALSNLPNDKWSLTLIGDGPLLQKIKQKAKKSGIHEQIIFLGEIKDIQPILQNSDIFLLISKSEGLPISIIEAMRARLAIIATDVGGISELIDHNENGLLIQKENIHDLIAALQLLCNNYPKRKTLAYRARTKYEQNFSFNYMLDQTENYYTKTIRRLLN